MINCVDLFCGVGGLTHGLSKEGINVIAGVDMDPNCRYPYEANNAARFIQTDICTLTGKTLNGIWKAGEEKLLAGCAPCQPFSTYSRKGRKARKDTKWNLVAEFGRLVRETAPDYVTMENVPQLAEHEVFHQFITKLKGYHVHWKIVDCAVYGVPQTRKRLVLLAAKAREIELVSPETFGRIRQRTVRDAISDLVPLAAGESHKQDALHSACSLSDLNLRRIRASKPGGSWRDWDRSLIARCHRRATGGTYPSVYGRMEWDAPAPTITTQCFGFGNGRFGHPTQDRAITLREAAILQTFPKSYRFLRDGERVRFNVLGRLIGNAVPVRLGEVIAASILRAGS